MIKKGRTLDQVSKHRLIGASIWLLALVLIVPSWYNNPVNFNPEGEMQPPSQNRLPVVEHAYRLPADFEPPVADAQTSVDPAQPAPEVSKTDEEDSTQGMRGGIKSDYIDQVTGDPSYQGQWIVRLQAFDNVKQANDLADQIQAEYPVYIKYFSKTDVYSVRTGPYNSRSKADKQRRKLDKMLRTDGEVVQIP